MPGEENQNYLRQRQQLSSEGQQRVRRAARIIPGVGATMDADAARRERERTQRTERERAQARQRNREFNARDPNVGVRRNAIIQRLQQQRAAQRQPPLSQNELARALSEYGL